MKATHKTVHSQTENATIAGSAAALARVHLGRLSLCKRLARALCDSSEASLQHLRHGEIRSWTSERGDLMAALDTYTNRLTVRWHGKLVMQTEPGCRPVFRYDAAWARELFRQFFRMAEPQEFAEQIRAKRKAAAWIIATGESTTVLFTKRTTGTARWMRLRCSERLLIASGGLEGCEKSGLIHVYDEECQSKGLPSSAARRQVNLDAVRSVEMADGALILFGAVGAGKGNMTMRRDRSDVRLPKEALGAGAA